MPALAWPVAAPAPHLGPDEVHVWAASLAVSADRLVVMETSLAAAERDRAARYLHPTARAQFLAARALLRALLGAYLGVAPEHVALGAGRGGKPALEPPHAELHFNVAHSHGMALFALTQLGPVGVDLERIRAYPTYLDMAARFFSRGEADALTRLPPVQAEEAFFHVWTRKEALLKATGLGLAGGLDSFEVSVPPDDPPRVLHLGGDRDAGAGWALTALAPASGFVGTLAVEGPAPRVCSFTYSGP
jgi:4'-phosphopantetheinyl transferase